MRKTANRSAGQGALRAICILLLLLLLVAILLTEVRRSTKAVGRERADEVTLTRTDTLTGYVFRDEIAVSSSNNGPVEYLVENGSLVLPNTELARIYTGSRGGSTQRDAAAPLYEEIERLEKALEEDMIAWQLSFTDSYTSLMSSVSAGKLAGGLNAAAELSDTLEKRSVLKGDGEAVRVRLATLRAQAAELVRYEDEPHVPVAGTSAYFLKSTDGYETLFDTAAAETLTPEGLTQLLSTDPAVGGDAALNIGKLVSAGPFYLAVPVTAEQAERYAVGGEYRVTMKNGGATTMSLARVAAAESGEALLLLYAERCPVGMNFSRIQTLTVEREYVKGLSVPAGAVFLEGDENFVYVVRSGVAEKRRVRVLCEDNGSCIVAADGGEGYLAAGENILVTWRSVYEGKELNR